MENASKALLMAASVLIAILIISLLVYAWSLFTEYQTSRDSLADIEDNAKFNAQFSDYDRDDVLGYEILSLLNKIVDYNERRTSDTEKGNEYKYPAVKITINFVSDELKKKLTYNNEVLLFKKTKYEDDELTVYDKENKKRASFDNTINETISVYQRDLGLDDVALTAMAKNIAAIFKTVSQQEGSAGISGEDDDSIKAAKMESVKKKMVYTFNSYSKNHQLLLKDEYYDMLTLEEKNGVLSPKTEKMKDEHGADLGNVYKTLCSYYEYMQFKRGIFKCTKTEYDTNNTGRLVSIAFEFTGKLK